jgi:NAD(P)-dependent dehydrogenase (short-subunit alcohol dehydrogenase family)
VYRKDILEYLDLITTAAMNLYNTSVFGITFFTLFMICGGWIPLLIAVPISLAAAWVYRKATIKRWSPNTKEAILITGCSSGVGKQLAISLARRGSLVFVGLRKGDKQSSLIEAAGTFGNNLVPIVFDVTKHDQIGQAVERVKQILQERDATLAAIVCNAAVYEIAPVEMLTTQRLKRSLDVNVVGAHSTAQAFLPVLRAGLETPGARKGRSRRIIFMSSVLAQFSRPCFGAYAASKAALEMMADSLRMELKKWNIDVSLIEPGLIQTEMIQKISEQASKIGDERAQEISPELSNYYTKHTAAFTKPMYTPFSQGWVLCELENALFESSPLTRYKAAPDAKLMLPVVARLPDQIRDAVVGWQMIPQLAAHSQEMKAKS